jgi:hypothetical protein
MIDNFVYCYLSPFVVGLLGFLVAIGALVAICTIISKTYNWVIYDIAPVGRLRKSIDWVVEFSTKWVIPVLVGGFCIFIVLLLAFGAWSLGLDILKRFACK